MELLSIAATAFVVALSGAMMPGPLLAVTLEESARRGASAGPLIVLGHMVLEALLVAAIAGGLATFLVNGTLIAAIGVAGGLAMCWMGSGMLRPAAPPGRTGTVAPRHMHPVLSGIVVSLANPYWIIWWATIGIAYIVLGLKFGLRGIVAFFAGHILADLAWYTLVSVGIARGRRWMPDRAFRVLTRFCGGVLVLFGFWFLWTGASGLAGALGGKLCP